MQSKLRFLVPRFRGNLVDPGKVQAAAVASAVLLAFLWLAALVCSVFQLAALRQIKLFPGVQLTVPPLTGAQYLSLYNTTSSRNNEAIWRTLVDDLGIGTEDRPGYEVLYNSRWQKAVYNDSGNIRSTPARVRFTTDTTVPDYYLLDMIVLQNLTSNDVSAVQRLIITNYIETPWTQTSYAAPSIYFRGIKEQQIKLVGFLTAVYLTLSYYCISLFICILPILSVPWYFQRDSAGYSRGTLRAFLIVYAIVCPLLALHPALATGYFVRRNQLNVREVAIINASALSKDYGIVASKMPFSPWIMHLSLITFCFMAVAVLLVGIVFSRLETLRETHPEGFYNARAQPPALVIHEPPSENIELAQPAPSSSSKNTELLPRDMDKSSISEETVWEDARSIASGSSGSSSWRVDEEKGLVGSVKKV